MGHQGPSVGLLLDVNVRGELQRPGARIGVLRLVLGWVGVQAGNKREGGMQEIFIDGLRRDWQRRLERGHGGRGVEA